MRVVRPVRPMKRVDRENAAPRFVTARAYEVLFMLGAAPHPRRFELARGWGAAMQRKLTAEARVTWRAFFGGDGAIGVEPARLVRRLGGLATVDNLVTLVRDLPPADLVLSFFGDAAMNPALADSVTKRMQRRTLTPGGEAVLATALAALAQPARMQIQMLLDDVEGARQSYSKLLLEADRHVLASQWAVIGPLLETTRNAYAQRYAGLSVPQLVETLAGVPVETATALDTAPLIVALSYHFHPFALLMHGVDGPLLVVGTRGEEVTADPDPGTIRVLKSLADATRLRILELIAERPRFVQELADMLDVRHPTVVHHLTLLRQAGLIDVQEEEGTTYYRLQPAMFEAVMGHLRRRLRMDEG